MTTLFLILSSGATAWAADVDFSCLPGDGFGIVGLPPVEVHCVVTPPAEGTWSGVSWTMGDGTLVYGDAVSYIYDNTGQYNVSVRLDDFDDGTEPIAGDLSDPAYEMKYGYVTVCGPPEPEFTYINKGGLDLQMVNTTAVSVHCIDDLVWEVFEGRGTQGKPIMRFDTWEPRFELPGEGRYTLSLTVNGYAGVVQAALPLDAKYSLTDDLKHGPRAFACNNAAGVLPSVGLFGVLLAMSFLRRRPQQ